MMITEREEKEERGREREWELENLSNFFKGNSEALRNRSNRHRRNSEGGGLMGRGQLDLDFYPRGGFRFFSHPPCK